MWQSYRYDFSIRSAGNVLWKADGKTITQLPIKAVLKIQKARSVQIRSVHLTTRECDNYLSSGRPVFLAILF